MLSFVLPSKLYSFREGLDLNKTEVENVQLGNTYLLLIWTNVPKTNVAQTHVVVTVVIYFICSQDPLFKV